MMFCFASRALCGSSKIELKMTDNEIFEELYIGAASENKQRDISVLSNDLFWYLYPCMTSFFSIFTKQSLSKYFKNKCFNINLFSLTYGFIF